MSEMVGKRFVLLGTFSVYQIQVKDLIEAEGGIVEEYIGDATNYVVCGRDPSPAKLRYAHMGCVIMNEDDLETMILAARAGKERKIAIRAEAITNHNYGTW